MSLSISNDSLLPGRNYIDGAWVEAVDGSTFPVSDPATD
ncbi:hypothetical protein C7399_1431, partial [Paraburkholderia tropica]